MIPARSGLSWIILRRGVIFIPALTFLCGFGYYILSYLLETFEKLDD